MLRDADLLGYRVADPGRLDDPRFISLVAKGRDPAEIDPFTDGERDSSAGSGGSAGLLPVPFLLTANTEPSS
jgi:hypothetical protein